MDDLNQPVPPPVTEPPFPIPVDTQGEAVPSSTPPSTPLGTSPPPPPTGEPAQVQEPFLKRFLPLIIGGIILLLLFFLVAKVILPRFQKAPEPETINLTYWGLWEPENIVSQVIEDYRALHPNVTISYTRQAPQDYRARLQSALARGDGPDIFRWHNTWLPMLKADLSPIPDSVYSPNEFDTTFYPVVKTDVFSGGNYLGVPIEFDTLALYVNEDVMEQNPDLKVPTTWDNLRQTAFRLKQVDPVTNQLTRGGIALGTTANVDHFSDIVGLMILQNGGDPGNPSTDTVASALKFYTLFSLADGTWDETLPNSTLAFATGKVVMMLAPSWRALEVKAINPQLNFKLYPAPQLPGTNITWASYWLEGVSRKSLKQEAAWEFVKYLSSRDTLLKFYNLASQNRLFGEPYARQDMASLLQQDPYLGAVINQAIAARSFPLASRTFDDGINDKLIKYYEDAINGLLDQGNEETIFAALSGGVAQVLAQYGLSTSQ